MSESNFQICCGVKTGCINSRLHGGYTRRRYECSRCGARFTTRESQLFRSAPTPLSRYAAEQRAIRAAQPRVTTQEAHAQARRVLCAQQNQN